MTILRTYTAEGHTPGGYETSISISETTVPESITICVGPSQIILSKEDWLKLTQITSRYNYSDFTWWVPEPQAEITPEESF
jgi:hypothetical protein